MSEPNDVFGGGPGRSAPRRAAHRPLFEPEELERRGDRRLLVVVAIAGLALVAMAIAALMLTKQGPGQGPGAPPSASTPSGPARTEDREVKQATKPEPAVPPEPVVRIGGLQADAQRQPAPVSDPAGLLRVLRSTLESDGGSETERAWRFEQAVQNFADSWVMFDRATIEEANRLVAQQVIAASRREGGAEAVLEKVGGPLERLASGQRLAAHEVWGAAWSAGAMAELAALADAPSAVRGRAHAALSAAGLSEGGGFYGGVTAALGRMPALIAGDGAGASGSAGDAGGAAAWRRWMQAVDAAWGIDATGKERALLRGAGDLLAAASGKAPDPTTRSIVLSMLALADWSANGAARGAVVSWLDDKDRIGSRELAAVTQWMVSNAPAAAIGVDQVLSAQADEQERARVRDALAARWSLNTPAMAQGVRAAWAGAAQAALANGGVLGSDAFARTARLARLSEAAALLRRGEAAQARVALNKAASGRVAPGAGNTGGALGADAAGRDGRWAVRFLGARRNAAERRAALASISVDGATLGVVDAEALVEAALLGAPVDVRDSALRVAEQHAGEATVVNALLEALPRAPRTAAAARLYERAARTSLPPVRHKDWPLATRRALVARLLESLDAGDGLSLIDEWAGVIADAYAGWSVTLSEEANSAASEAERRAEEEARYSGGTAEESAPETLAGVNRRRAMEPADAAAATLEDLRDEILSLGDPAAARALREQTRRHAARRMLATGGLQAFVAEQAGTLEAMALLVSTERPGAAATAQGIVEAAAKARAEATVVEAQMEATQRAILEMWMLLLDAGGTT